MGDGDTSRVRLKPRGRPRYAGALTPRQQDVFELLATGLTNEEIAQHLGITPYGVKYHVAEILQRLGVENRYQASALHLRADGRGRLAAWAPVLFLRKLPFAWLSKAAAGAVLAAAAAGIALLAWGVMSMQRDDGRIATVAMTTTGCSIERTAGGAPDCAAGVAQTGAGADTISAMSAGLFHSCALKDGGVWCWGGYLIQDGIAEGSVVPVAVAGLGSGVSEISSGIGSCALKDGGVWCWSGLTMTVGVPAAVPGLASGVGAIGAGRNDACALKDGGVWCWSWGHLTPGVPVAVPGLESGVSAISGLCAVKDGGVWCWSGNWEDEGPVAAAVPGLASGVSAISTGAGGDNSCALKDGGAWCWVGSTVPVAVPGLASGVSAISAGYYHTCAVKDGGAWCWRAGSTVAVAVSGLGSGVSAISAGEDHSCALKDDGAWCWGNNQAGQLGNNSTTDSPVPVAVLFAPPSDGDIATEPDAQPPPSQTATDSADHRTTYVLGGTAAAATLAIVAAGGWAMRRRRRIS